MGAQRLAQSHTRTSTSTRAPSHAPSQAVTSMVNQFSDFDIQNARGEEILRMISIDSPAVQQHNGHPPLPSFSTSSIASTTSGCEAACTKPDVIPNTISGRASTLSNYCKYHDSLSPLGLTMCTLRCCLLLCATNFVFGQQNFEKSIHVSFFCESTSVI